MSLYDRDGYILTENGICWVKCVLNNVKSSLNPQRAIARGRDLCHNADRRKELELELELE